jgi:hypothetical protein
MSTPIIDRRPYGMTESLETPSKWQSRCQQEHGSTSTGAAIRAHVTGSPWHIVQDLIRRHGCPDARIARDRPHAMNREIANDGPMKQLSHFWRVAPLTFPHTGSISRSRLHLSCKECTDCSMGSPKIPQSREALSTLLFRSLSNLLKYALRPVRI